MPSNILYLNLRYLKIIRILHPRHHPKIIGRILKIKQRTSVFLAHGYMAQIDLDLDMDTNIANKESVSV